MNKTLKKKKIGKIMWSKKLRNKFSPLVKKKKRGKLNLEG